MTARASLSRPELAPLKRAVYRFVLASATVTVLAVFAQNTLVSALLPVFRGWLDLIDDEFLTLDLSLLRDHGEFMIRRLALPMRPGVLGPIADGGPQTIVSSQASAGMVLQPAILALGLLFAWPCLSRAELRWRAFVGTLVLPLMLLLDVPVMLYGFAWDQELTLRDPQHLSLLVSWSDAMNAGGRFVLAVAAAVIATLSARQLARPAR